MSGRALHSICRSCQLNGTTFILKRAFSTSIRHSQNADGTVTQQVLQQGVKQSSKDTGRFRSRGLENLAEGARAEATTRPGSGVSMDEPYHLTVYSHKHNMHLTFTDPSRNTILTFSAGNLGLRKAQRGSFDAAYQLATYTFRKMAEKQWRIGGKAATFNPMLTLNDTEVRTRGIEVVLRGYGPGREAFQKAILGTEGKIIKPMVKRVTDSTRLKFGGTRSRAVRRLG